MECDFCFVKHPSWQYRAKEFSVVDNVAGIEPTRHFSAVWAACSDCARLIDAGDVAGLVKRSALRQVKAACKTYRKEIERGGREPILRRVVGEVKLVIEAFAARRVGEREAIAPPGLRRQV